SCVLELDKKLQILTNVGVSMNLRPLNQVAIGACRAEPEKRCLADLEALAQIGAQRQIRIWVTSERDIFQAVERLARYTGILENGPIFLPAIEHDNRPLDFTRP